MKWNTRKYEDVDFSSIQAGDRIQVKRFYASRFSNDYLVKEVEDTWIGRIIYPFSGAAMIESHEAESLFRKVV